MDTTHVPSAPAACASRRVSAALDLLPDAGLELAADGTVVAANDLALGLFGCAREDLVGAALEPLVSLGELLVDTGERDCRRLEGRRANGVPLLLEASVRWVDTECGRHAVCVLRELSFDGLVTEAQRYFDVAFDSAPIGMALFNCDGEYVRVNDALCELLARSRDELIGRRDQELTHPEDRQSDVDAAWAILAGEFDTHQCEKRFVRPDGTVVWSLANLTFLRDEAQRPLGWVGQFQDVTARRLAEEAMAESEERFRLAFDHAPIGLALVSPDGDWLRVNATLCDMTGYAEADLLTSTFQDITHPDDLDADLQHVQRMLAGELRTYDMEKRYIRADGSIVWILLSVSLVRDAAGEPLYFISQIQDIDARKRAQQELEHLAHHDPLTGALNRRAWDIELDRSIAHTRRTGRPLAIALIDLNGFKQVNDVHGHVAGDQLLRQAADAWHAQLRAGDRLARLGGDEFAVLLPDCPPESLDGIARRLREALPHEAGCGIGVAVWAAGDGPTALLCHADAALYADKAATLSRVSDPAT